MPVNNENTDVVPEMSDAQEIDGSQDIESSITKRTTTAWTQKLPFGRSKSSSDEGYTCRTCKAIDPSASKAKLGKLGVGTPIGKLSSNSKKCRSCKMFLISLNEEQNMDIEKLASSIFDRWNLKSTYSLGTVTESIRSPHASGSGCASHLKIGLFTGKSEPAATFDVVEGLPLHSLQGAYFQRRLLPRRVDFEEVGKWVSNCYRAHYDSFDTAKELNFGSAAPFKVIDVEGLKVIRPTASINYLILSYVWGDAMKVPREDLIHPDGSLGEGLPATILDAIEVTRQLGFQYLWIDSLCIDQANEDEKGRLVSRMDMIYKGARLTIVAAVGVDASAAFPGVQRERFAPDEKPVLLRTENGDLRLLKTRPSLKSMIETSTWNTRGWTFQEHILSPRCLYFSETEAFFTCNRGCEFRESYSIRLSKLHNPPTCCHESREGRLGKAGEELRPRMKIERRTAKGKPNMSTYEGYTLLISQYTERNLSFPKDVVRAVEGTMKAYWRDALNDAALTKASSSLRHGFPIGRLEIAMTLLWVPRDPNNFSRRPENDTERFPSRWPTWSWTGWAGPIDFVGTMRDGKPAKGSTWITDAYRVSTQIDMFKQLRLDFEPNGELQGGYNFTLPMPASRYNNMPTLVLCAMCLDVCVRRYDSVLRFCKGSSCLYYSYAYLDQLSKDPDPLEIFKFAVLFTFREEVAGSKAWRQQEITSGHYYPVSGYLGLLLQRSGEVWHRVGLAAVQSIHPIKLAEELGGGVTRETFKDGNTSLGEMEWLSIE